MFSSSSLSAFLVLFCTVSALPRPQASSVTAADLSSHSSTGDCWVAYNNHAYDVTSFISKHPGGDVFTAFCGKADDSFGAKFASAPHGATDSLIAGKASDKGAISAAAPSSPPAANPAPSSPPSTNPAPGGGDPSAGTPANADKGATPPPTTSSGGSGGSYLPPPATPLPGSSSGSGSDGLMDKMFAALKKYLASKMQSMLEGAGGGESDKDD